MSRYLAGRVVQFVIVVAGSLLLVFVALHIVADPARSLLPLGTPEEVIREFRSSLGLDDPFVEQLWHFVTHAVRGDFGRSVWIGGDALEHAVSRIPATLMIALPATLLGGGMGVYLGSVSSRRPEAPLSQALNVVSYLAMSVAEFWVGIMAILIFAVQLRWLPTGGFDPKPSVLVLPVIVLSLRPFAQTLQLTRATMIAERSKQYVMTARAKGLTEAQVSRQHMLRNAAIPIVTLGLYQLSRVFIGTAIIVEVVFAWPGIGRLAVEALNQGDVYLVEATVAVGAIGTALLNLFADLLYFRLDPRTRSLVRGNR